MKTEQQKYREEWDDGMEEENIAKIIDRHRALPKLPSTLPLDHALIDFKCRSRLLLDPRFHSVFQRYAHFSGNFEGPLGRSSFFKYF